MYIYTRIHEIHVIGNIPIFLERFLSIDALRITSNYLYLSLFQYLPPTSSTQTPGANRSRVHTLVHACNMRARARDVNLETTRK